MSLITGGLGESMVMAPISVNVIEQIDIDQDGLVDLTLELEGSEDLVLTLENC
jgi:hypothetical protein